MGGANKLYTVIVSDRATDMLMQHVRFMAQTSLKAADKLRTEIIEAAKSLESFPERNSWLSDPVLPAHKYRKMIISKRYLLIYQIKDDAVFIEYILDCRQDYKWLL
ncbi:MAG: type II toxin-antitoxin system RelE/ParE family toxin [Peptococcaceae bacterium]|nr:type II toxin-antitoxin system RelE/ParE family toxin [Peptococcaceae bacterium]